MNVKNCKVKKIFNFLIFFVLFFVFNLAFKKNMIFLGKACELTENEKEKKDAYINALADFKNDTYQHKNFHKKIYRDLKCSYSEINDTNYGFLWHLNQLTKQYCCSDFLRDFKEKYHAAKDVAEKIEIKEKFIKSIDVVLAQIENACEFYEIFDDFHDHQNIYEKFKNVIQGQIKIFKTIYEKIKECFEKHIEEIGTLFFIRSIGDDNAYEKAKIFRLLSLCRDWLFARQDSEIKDEEGNYKKGLKALMVVIKKIPELEEMLMLDDDSQIKDKEIKNQIKNLKFCDFEKNEMPDFLSGIIDGHISDLIKKYFTISTSFYSQNFNFFLPSKQNFIDFKELYKDPILEGLNEEEEYKKFIDNCLDEDEDVASNFVKEISKEMEQDDILKQYSNFSYNANANNFFLVFKNLNELGLLMHVEKMFYYKKNLEDLDFSVFRNSEKFKFYFKNRYSILKPYVQQVIPFKYDGISNFENFYLSLLETIPEKCLTLSNFLNGLKIRFENLKEYFKNYSEIFNYEQIKDAEISNENLKIDKFFSTDYELFSESKSILYLKGQNVKFSTKYENEDRSKKEELNYLKKSIKHEALNVYLKNIKTAVEKFKPFCKGSNFAEIVEDILNILAKIKKKFDLEVVKYAGNQEEIKRIKEKYLKIFEETFYNLLINADRYYAAKLKYFFLDQGKYKKIDDFKTDLLNFSSICLANNKNFSLKDVLVKKIIKNVVADIKQNGDKNKAEVAKKFLQALKTYEGNKEANDFVYFIKVVLECFDDFERFLFSNFHEDYYELTMYCDDLFKKVNFKYEDNCLEALFCKLDAEELKIFQDNYSLSPEALKKIKNISDLKEDDVKRKLEENAKQQEIKNIIFPKTKLNKIYFKVPFELKDFNFLEDSTDNLEKELGMLNFIFNFPKPKIELKNFESNDDTGGVPCLGLTTFSDFFGFNNCEKELDFYLKNVRFDTLNDEIDGIEQNFLFLKNVWEQVKDCIKYIENFDVSLIENVKKINEAEDEIEKNVAKIFILKILNDKVKDFKFTTYEQMFLSNIFKINFFEPIIENFTIKVLSQYSKSYSKEQVARAVLSLLEEIYPLYKKCIKFFNSVFEEILQKKPDEFKHLKVFSNKGNFENLNGDGNVKNLKDKTIESLKESLVLDVILFIFFEIDPTISVEEIIKPLKPKLLEFLKIFCEKINNMTSSKNLNETSSYLKLLVKDNKEFENFLNSDGYNFKDKARQELGEIIDAMEKGGKNSTNHATKFKNNSNETKIKNENNENKETKTINKNNGKPVKEVKVEPKKENENMENENNGTENNETKVNNNLEINNNPVVKTFVVNNPIVNSQTVNQQGSTNFNVKKTALVSSPLSLKVTQQPSKKAKTKKSTKVGSFKRNIKKKTGSKKKSRKNKLAKKKLAKKFNKRLLKRKRAMLKGNIKKKKNGKRFAFRKHS